MIAIMILWNSGPPWFDAWNVNELSWIRCVTIEVLTDSFLLCSNGKDVFLSRCGRRILLTIYQCKCSYYKRDGQSSEPVGSCTTLGDFLYRISLQEALYNTLMKSSLYFFFFFRINQTMLIHQIRKGQPHDIALSSAFDAVKLRLALRLAASVQPCGTFQYNLASRFWYDLIQWHMNKNSGKVPTRKHRLSQN